ncbi:carboxylesterase type B [Streptacidiphilus sp. MAP12-33]
MPVPHPRPWNDPPPPDSTDDRTVVVSTSSGRLRGERDGDSEVFRGIPYAAPPVGNRRFRPPVPAPSWPGVRDARSYGPAAPQNPDLVLE